MDAIVGVDAAAGGTQMLEDELAALMSEFAGPEPIGDWEADAAAHGLVPIEAGAGPIAPLPPLQGDLAQTAVCTCQIWDH